MKEESTSSTNQSTSTYSYSYSSSSHDNNNNKQTTTNIQNKNDPKGMKIKSDYDIYNKIIKIIILTIIIFLLICLFLFITIIILKITYQTQTQTQTQIDNYIPFGIRYNFLMIKNESVSVISEIQGTVYLERLIDISGHEMEKFGGKGQNHEMHVYNGIETFEGGSNKYECTTSCICSETVNENERRHGLVIPIFQTILAFSAVIATSIFFSNSEDKCHTITINDDKEVQNCEIDQSDTKCVEKKVDDDDVKYEYKCVGECIFVFADPDNGETFPIRAPGEQKHDLKARKVVASNNNEAIEKVKDKFFNEECLRAFAKFMKSEIRPKYPNIPLVECYNMFKWGVKSVIYSNSLCTGCPPEKNGLPCASTTHYGWPVSDPGSACGCFDNWVFNGISPYTAAPNENFYGKNTVTQITWCGRRCGECYRLTTTGGWINNMATPNPTPGESIIVQVVDVCPIQGNLDWCGQSKDPISCERDGDCNSHVNDYGYLAHFDLHNDAGQINNLGWDNPEVTYERVVCPDDTKWPTCTDCYGDTQPFPFNEWRYDKCESTVCSGHSTCDKSTGNCVCDSGWSVLPNCDVPICNTPPCDAPNAQCIAPNTCQCKTGYTNPPDCDIPSGTCSPSCNLHQTCNDKNKCICIGGWESTNCNTPICSNPTCNDHQNCTFPNNCECFIGWIGSDCQDRDCNLNYAGDLCDECLYGYGGEDCNKYLFAAKDWKWILPTIFGSITAILCVIIVLSCVFVCCIKIFKKPPPLSNITSDQFAASEVEITEAFHLDL